MDAKRWTRWQPENSFVARWRMANVKNLSNREKDRLVKIIEAARGVEKKWSRMQ
jgi:hypothetical protein